MKTETRTALTPLDLCTLIAHEAVSLLNVDAGTLDAAAQLQEGLKTFASAKGLTDETGDLLVWIEQEVESSRQFAATGQDGPHLIDPDKLLPVPDAAAQEETVWALFQTAVQSTWGQRRILFETARRLTEMGGLEDMLLTANVPAAGFLTANDLRTELEEVRAAIRAQEAELKDAIQIRPAQM